MSVSFTDVQFIPGRLKQGYIVGIRLNFRKKQIPNVFPEHHQCNFIDLDYLQIQLGR